MIGNLRPKSADAASFVDLRYTNVQSLITAATLLGTGREISDVYTITASSVSLGSPHTFTATVSAASGKGPYHGRVVSGVIADAATTNGAILDGIELTFTASGSLANGWSSVVYVGISAGVRIAGNPTGTQLLWEDGIDDPGEISVAAGEPGAMFKVIVTNVGAETLAGAKLVFRPRAKLVNKTSPWGLESIQVIDDTPAERVDGAQKVIPIAITFDNFTAGSPNLIDVLKDEGSGAATFLVRDLDAGANVTSTQLQADGVTRYQVRASGSKIENLIFVIATTATESSVENILVFNKRHIQLALDVAGTPGTWTDDEIVLTQSGEPSGVILPAGAVVVWIRWNIASTASAKQNPFPGDLVAEYALTDQAGWLD